MLSQEQDAQAPSGTPSWLGDNGRGTLFRLGGSPVRGIQAWWGSEERVGELGVLQGMWWWGTNLRTPEDPESSF